MFMSMLLRIWFSKNDQRYTVFLPDTLCEYNNTKEKITRAELHITALSMLCYILF